MSHNVSLLLDVTWLGQLQDRGTYTGGKYFTVYILPVPGFVRSDKYFTLYILPIPEFICKSSCSVMFGAMVLMSAACHRQIAIFVVLG